MTTPTKEQIEKLALACFKDRFIDETHPQFNEVWSVMKPDYTRYAKIFITEWEKIKKIKECKR